MLEDKDISIAKIVATPGESSWSQAYSAGRLFAVLSLEKNKEEERKEEEKEDFLNLLGKDILNTLEEEFFTLETKDLFSIKETVLTTAKKLPDSVFCSFVIAAIVDNVLYAFIVGDGKINIKREDKFGIIIESSQKDASSIKAASGFLQSGDIIILQTKQFSEIITKNLLISSLDNQPPSEISEILAPLVHEHGKGGSAAIVIGYKPGESEKEVLSKELPKQEEFPSSIHRVLLRLGNLGHPRKTFLTVITIILIVFIVAVIFAIKKQNNARVQALFAQIYPQAQEKYDEGESLLGLNKNLARDSFVASQKILNDGKSKFSKNSKEEKQILDLLTKVNKELEIISPEKIAQNQDKNKIGVTVENGSGVEGTAGEAADFLKAKGYNIVSTGNADSYNYKGVTIKVKSSTNLYLSLLKKDLAEKYTVSNTSSDLSQNFTADALVIIGK